MACDDIGCGGREGSGGSASNDHRKSENADGEFHNEVTPLWISVDRNFFPIITKILTQITSAKSTFFIDIGKFLFHE
jgi:hypothetical protein